MDFEDLFLFLTMNDSLMKAPSQKSAKDQQAKYETVNDDLLKLLI